MLIQSQDKKMNDMMEATETKIEGVRGEIRNTDRKIDTVKEDIQTMNVKIDEMAQLMSQIATKF